jgi:hypothetical protein
MTQTGYDALTFIHWLYWRLRCLEGPPESFERLFQSVAARADRRFVRIKPYGNIGDRKVDGLYWGDGAAYQVYSPDEMKQAETRRKIEEDVAGAAEHWGPALRSWTFVYNARRGLAPDVVGMLQEQQGAYPDLKIDLLSDHDLWDLVRAMPAQQRVEILGPPPGYERLFPLDRILPASIQASLKDGRFIVVQDIMSPINVADVLKAIRPARPFGPPLFIRPAEIAGRWQVAADYQKTVVDEALAESRESLPRFAVFSLAPIPLAIHLGYLLTDRIEVEPFQYDRERRTWRWPEAQGPPNQDFSTTGLPTASIIEPVEVAIRVSLSADVAATDSQALTGRLPVEVDLKVSNPDVMWLVSCEQLVALSRNFRAILRELRSQVPNCTKLHLFYAGPTGGAIVLGQALNPRMNPRTVLYEHHRQREPRYDPVLTLGA